MLWQHSPVMVLFVSLAVALHYGSQGAAGFPGVTNSSRPTRAATIQATAKPSFLQPTTQEPHRTTAVRSTSGHVPSQIAATTSNSESSATHTIKTLATASLITTNSTPSTSLINYTLITTLATLNNSHTATAPGTEATIGPVATTSSLPSTLTPPVRTTGTSPPTVSLTTEKTVPPSNPSTLPTTLSISPHISTDSQKPSQPSHAPGTTTAGHSATHTAPPTTMAPGPTLAPQPSSVKTGIYQVLNGSRLCIKAEMGIELIVQDVESVFSPQRYFNIDPNATQASGNCGFQNSNLLLNFHGGFVNLTFTKDGNSYYINEVEAYLTVSNPEKSYHGVKSTVTMFEAVIGHSFKCVSEQSIQLSAHLQLKTMNVQLQAFDFEDDHFGNEDECFSDRNRREIPVAVGLSIAVLLVILLTACLVARKRPSRGYELDECSSDYTIVLPVIGACLLGLCALGLIVYGIRLRRESSGYQRI